MVGADMVMNVWVMGGCCCVIAGTARSKSARAAAAPLRSRFRAGIFRVAVREQRLEDIFETELNQARGNAHRRDLAEGTAVDRRARVAEVRMVEGVVEFRAELDVGSVRRAGEFEGAAEREIGGALGRPKRDADPAAAPPVTVADGHRSAVQRVDIEIVVELGIDGTGHHDVAVCGARAHLRARRAAENVGERAIAEGQRVAGLDGDYTRDNPSVTERTGDALATGRRLPDEVADDAMGSLVRCRSIAVQGMERVA